jgi:hypothetical protein
MMNEEVAKEIVDGAARELKEEVVKPAQRIVVECIGKPTAQMLVKGLKAAVTAPGKAIRNKLHPEHGEMKVKDLIRKDQGAQAIDIDGAGLGDFRRIANKYGVDFAIVKSTELDPSKYSVFFKARDTDAINAVVNEYTAKQMRIGKEGRPSLLEKLGKFKAIEAALPKKVVEKHKEVDR